MLKKKWVRGHFSLDHRGKLVEICSIKLSLIFFSDSMLYYLEIIVSATLKETHIFEENLFIEDDQRVQYRMEMT